MKRRCSPQRVKNSKLFKFRKHIQLEQLEARMLLASDVAALSEVASRLENRLTGATIITHGFQLGDDENQPSPRGDSLLPLAQAIHSRANTSASTTNPSAFLVDYELSGESGQQGIDLTQSILPALNTSTKGELVLLFDWSFESNEASPAGRQPPAMRSSALWFN